MSFFDGNLSFFRGDMSFFNGDLSFFHGDMSFFRGNLSFFRGDMPFFNGILSFFYGDMSFFNGVYLELFTKGFVCRAIENGEIKINRLVAQKEIRFSNSMIEVVNKRMKYDFLFRARLPDIEQTCRFLEIAVEQYNNRSHSALFGFTPQELFYGAIPDKLFFKPRIEQAKALRKAENQALSCHHCALTEAKEQ